MVRSGGRGGSVVVRGLFPRLMQGSKLSFPHLPPARFGFANAIISM